jgi:hypothetical protein
MPRLERFLLCDMIVKMKMKLKCFRRATVALLLIVMAGAAQAATNYAASVTFAAVSAAVSSSSPGDTVVLPPGTASWTSPLTLNAVSLVGAGTNQTVIIDNLDRSVDTQSPLIFLHGSPNVSALIRISGIQFQAGNTTRNYHGVLAVDAASPVRLDHLFLNRVNDRNIYLHFANQTLIDHCVFILQTSGVQFEDAGYGDASWSLAPNLGGLLVPCVEDCSFINYSQAAGTISAATDGEAGARFVFRHNLVQNALVANHGTESGQRVRGTRQFEIYSNDLSMNPAWYYPYVINIRSGSGVVFGNTAQGTASLVGIDNFRSGQRFAPFGGADGINTWDNIAGTNYAAGTHTGGNGTQYLEKAGAGWSINQWIGYTVVNLGITANSDPTAYNYNFSTIFSNSATRVYYNPSKEHGYMVFSTGQPFTINKVYPALDQPGAGKGDLVLGDQLPWGPDPTNTVLGGFKWPRQTIEGIYGWNNTLNGNSANVGSVYPTLQENRDYYNTPEPGYQPLAYPHPLQGGGGGGGSSSLLLPPNRVWVQQ